MTTYLLLAVLPLATNCAFAQSASQSEVEAAFIHNIVKFVTWPDVAVLEGPQKLCLFGQDGTQQIAGTVQGKPVGRGNWEIVFVGPKSSLAQCRVLFIAASEAPNLRRILDSVGRNAVLTVGDRDGFAAAGVMVNFYLEHDKVRFEINPDAVGRAGLSIGSQVLKLARIVREAGGKQ